MDSKFFNIPFLTRTYASDFSCNDGELRSLSYGNNKDTEGFVKDREILPPVPDIEFAISRDVLHGWHVNMDSYPVKTLVATDPSMEYWNKLSAQLLSQFQSEAFQQCLFVAPFFVMVAWKTSEGFYLTPSRPLLMVPNSVVPVVTTDGDILSKELEFKIAGALGRLNYKLASPEILRDWVGIIESLQIFVSEPLLKYSTFDSLLPLRRVTTDNYGSFLDLNTDEIVRYRICTEEFPLAWKRVSDYNDFWKNFTTRKFFPVAELPLSGMAPGDVPVWKDVKIETTGFDGEGSPYSEIIDSATQNSKAKEIIIQGTGEKIELVTRPLKLGNAGKLKRISQLYLRGNYTPGNIEISVYGSRDMIQWWCISRRKGGTMVRLPGSPFRFYRLKVRGLLEEGENLQGFSIC